MLVLLEMIRSSCLMTLSALLLMSGTLVPAQCSCSPFNPTNGRNTLRPLTAMFREATMTVRPQYSPTSRVSPRSSPRAMPTRSWMACLRSAIGPLPRSRPHIPRVRCWPRISTASRNFGSSSNASSWSLSRLSTVGCSCMSILNRIDLCWSAWARLSSFIWVSWFSSSIRLAMFGSPVAMAFMSARLSTVASTSDASRDGEPELMIWLMNRALRSTVWNM